MQTIAKSIEYEIKEYAEQFLKAEYGEQAAMDALPRIRELITRSSSGNPMPKQQ